MVRELVALNLMGHFPRHFAHAQAFIPTSSNATSNFSRSWCSLNSSLLIAATTRSTSLMCIRRMVCDRVSNRANSSKVHRFAGGGIHTAGAKRLATLIFRGPGGFFFFAFTFTVFLQ